MKRLILLSLVFIYSLSFAQIPSIGEMRNIETISVSSPTGPWVSNTDIVSGLTTISAGYSSPIVFTLNSELYLIAGYYGSGYVGYKWNGSSWVSNSSIISGLGGQYAFAWPAVFEYNGSLYLIAGQYYLGYDGYKWNGSSWVSNASAVNGISHNTSYDFISTFTIGSSIYAFAQYGGSTIYSYIWNGSGWTSNSAIKAGINTSGNYYGGWVSFELNSDQYGILFDGNSYLNGTGYIFNGSGWTANSTIQTGLESLNSFCRPTSFWLDGSLYIILGGSDGAFRGYKYQ